MIDMTGRAHERFIMSFGLGVNLFGEEQTLAEKYGYDYMFGELRKTSIFYDWELLYPKEG